MGQMLGAGLEFWWSSYDKQSKSAMMYVYIYIYELR